ncbi:MAG: flagellar filament capping protein FliD [Campylobacterota bacterium]|nr:flagellar filament capping protein FliD [Campylobacterota bacterium]
MGISSLGAGSSILTQDVIDQLKAADNAKFVAPIDSKMKDEEDKSAAFKTLEAHMESVYESLKSLTEYGVFEGRTTSLSNEDSIDVVASDSSDIQNFVLDVTTIATKEIEQSGAFTTKTDSIATGSGTMDLNVGSETFTFDYDSGTTLDDLKELINKEAGDSVTATIVQVADDDFRLLLSASDTGTNQAISITDNDGDLSKKLTNDMSNVQSGVDAEFTFNGLDITRSSNSVDDLLSGVTITLKELGTTNVKVQQDREKIEEKITNFVDKYNSAMYQLGEDTKSSTDEDERGAFSSDSTIKGMKTDLKNILSIVGGDAGRLQDFGIEVDEGRLSLDSELLNEKLDDNPENVHAYFIGGTFTKDDSSTIEVEGAFTELESEFAKYSKGGSILDKYNDSITTRLESLSKQREKAVERLDDSYEIMAKRFASYDLIINQFNQASDMFTQMINAEIAASR